MLKFAFINDAAEKEYKDFPEEIQDEFGKAFRKIQYGEDPSLPIEKLSGFDIGTKEIKINGSPAYRCVYVTRYLNTIIILHSFEKTTNGTDRPAMIMVEKRLKDLKAELRKEGVIK